MTQNYLAKKPMIHPGVCWRQDETGHIIVEQKHTGVFNRVAHKIFKRPAVTYVELEGLGNFVWQAMDGEKTVFDLGKDLSQHFGEKAAPVYERLIQYLKILHSYGFIYFKKEE